MEIVSYPMEIISPDETETVRTKDLFVQHILGTSVTGHNDFNKHSAQQRLFTHFWLIVFFIFPLYSFLYWSDSSVPSERISELKSYQVRCAKHKEF